LEKQDESRSLFFMQFWDLSNRACAQKNGRHPAWLKQTDGHILER
jgi:hypothetical protein